MINGFQVRRWIERWMISRLRGPERAETRGALTLWQIHWPWQPNLDRSTGDKDVACVHWCRLCTCFFLKLIFTPRTITRATQLTAGAAIMLTSCQENCQSGGRPASRSWRAALRTVVTVRSVETWRPYENMRSKVRRRPGWLYMDGVAAFPGRDLEADTSISSCLHTTCRQAAERQQMFIRMNSMSVWPAICFRVPIEFTTRWL